jgi:hypothetical protein
VGEAGPSASAKMDWASEEDAGNVAALVCTKSGEPQRVQGRREYAGEEAVEGSQLETGQSVHEVVPRVLRGDFQWSARLMVERPTEAAPCVPSNPRHEGTGAPRRRCQRRWWAKGRRDGPSGRN